MCISDCDICLRNSSFYSSFLCQCIGYREYLIQQRKVWNYLFSNLCLHSTAIPCFISKRLYSFIIIFAFFYSGSVEELTHSRELGGAVTQVLQKITLYSKALNRQSWINKSFQPPAVYTRLCWCLPRSKMITSCCSKKFLAQQNVENFLV